jgi:hypothetical protein
MRRFIRLVLSAGIASSVLLFPVSAHETTQVSFYGFEYATANNCGSFAGLANVKGPTALFNTNICHDPLGDTNGASAEITGGSFVIYTQPAPRSGTIADGGSVGPGVITPLGAFCTETFPVNATFTEGGGANATLTHVGILSVDNTVEHCMPFAASVKGQATLP